MTESRPVPPPPWHALRARLDAYAAALVERGHADVAAGLRALVDAWWTEQTAWESAVTRQLGVHHDINNALVGVRGNAQLLLLGAAGREPALRERLEVMMREAARIQEAVRGLHELKGAFGLDDAVARARRVA